MAPAPADAAEVADRQTQASPLGLSGDTSKKKKKSTTTTGEKTRLTDKNKKLAAPAPDATVAPAATAPQTPPATTPPSAPATQPQQ
jgi:hypothetical protein